MADPIEVAKNAIEKFNAGDWTGLQSTLTPDTVEDEFATQRRLEGPEAVVGSRGLESALSPMPMGDGPERDGKRQHGHPRDHLGGHSDRRPGAGPAGHHSGVRATGQPASRMGGGGRGGNKVNAVRHYFDLMTLLAQIGAVPAGTT